MEKSQNSDKSKNTWILIFVIFGVLVLLVVILVGVIIFLVIYFNQKEDDKLGKEIHHYQHLHVNSKTGAKSAGFASIFELFDREEFDSYVDDENNFNLISNLGATEFECTGTCACETERKSAAVINGGYYLVPAVTALIAYRLARDHFKDECEDALQDSCALSAISSNVEKCDKIAKTVGNEQTIETESYHCEGNCEPCYGSGPPKWRAACDAFECEKLYLEGDVEVDKNSIDGDDVALEVFLVKMLHPFCRRKSVDEKNFSSRSRSFCTGEESGNVNNSIRCRKKLQ